MEPFLFFSSLPVCFHLFLSSLMPLSLLMRRYPGPPETSSITEPSRLERLVDRLVEERRRLIFPMFLF
jgi:hypothetical protein